MKQKSVVLIQNEKQANRAVAKVMRITFIIFSLVYLLNVVGIFKVSMGVMTVAYLIGSLLLWIPTIVVNGCKIQDEWVKYLLTVCAVLFVTVATITLTYHVVIIYVYAIGVASLYFSKKLNVIVTTLSVIGVSVGQWIAYVLQTLPDNNFYNGYRLLVFGIIPRALVLIAVAAIFTMLCRRTAELLSNLMGAEEQEKMMNRMMEMQEKSTQTSRALYSMVKELSVISEASMKANGQIVEETGNVLQSIRANSGEMTSVNERTQNINEHLVELGDINDQVAGLAEKVNERTKENQEKMDSATESMEQIHERTKECTDVISRLGEQSKEILGIVQTITGISSQTNILALNASIEAARAGEQGKGFAVVAEEIQKLSEQTKAAVEDIGSIVYEAVNNTEKAVSSMEKSAELTQIGMEGIREVGNSTSIITSSNLEMSERILVMDKTAENVRRMSDEVAKSMASVSEATRDNYEAIEHVTAATQENSAGVMEVEKMVEQIKKLAEELNRVVQG